MSAKANAPIIIKRKKVVAGGGHHGGAWKVAYADFVTAMMAFFMLMWLLNATTEKQRKGIADYFNPTIPINRISGGGEGSFGGTNIFSEQVLAQNGTGASLKKPTDENQARGESGVDVSEVPEPEKDPAEEAMMAEIADVLTGRGGESMVSEEMMRHIVTRVTDEGLIVEVFDTADAALFLPDTDQPTPLMQALARIMSDLFRLTPNQVAIGGHTSARPVVMASNIGWDLSSGRADQMRRLLEEAGLSGDRTIRVTGHADRNPAVADPMAPRNNRLEVVLLREGG